MLQLKNVGKSFKNGQQILWALKNANFVALPGEFVAIIGPSGSGKSTFLTIAGGLQQPTEGEVSLDGQSLEKASLKELAKLRFTRLGFILQASSLVPFLKIRDQFALHFKVSGDSVPTGRIVHLARELDIEGILDKYPGDISGGQRQRAAIANALMHDPEVILADEPTASLDTERAIETVKLLAKLTHENNKITIMVTHDQRLLKYCDRVWSIVDGRLSEQRDFKILVEDCAPMLETSS